MGNRNKHATNIINNPNRILHTKTKRVQGENMIHAISYMAGFLTALILGIIIISIWNYENKKTRELQKNLVFRLALLIDELEDKYKTRKK